MLKMTSQFGSQSFRQVRFGSGSTILTARAGEAISLDEIAQRAPAVFATERHESRSERYEFLDTRAVMQGLVNNGFGVFEVRQGGSRIQGKREFTKHMLRLRYQGESGQGALVRGNDRVLPEIVITNAHDGTASWQMGAGCFRIICANGLIAGDLFDYVRIRHNRAGPEQVIEGAYRVIEQFPRMIEGAQTMGEIALDRDEQTLFAHAARQLRWDGDAASPVEAANLLIPKRAADRGNDLWSTFNVTQEHLLRGGDHYRHRSATTGRVSYRQTGEIRSIDDTSKLNRALWTLAQGMADLKEGRALQAA
jgi:hypothetical protein